MKGVTVRSMTSHLFFHTDTTFDNAQFITIHEHFNSGLTECFWPPPLFCHRH